ncbi:MAG: glycosyltransferase family 2 protein [Prevotella sp.]|nr:glycosyltransferase family 2 protein [Prevotella sp.]
MRISVCMATYNGERYIEEQIHSILSQLSDDDELIISDDGSHDRTLFLIQSIGDKRIRIFQNEGRHGFKYNFENAMKMVQGDYIFLCDQDDVWLPDKVSVSLEKLQDYDLIVHDAKLIDSEGKDLNNNFYSFHHDKTGFWSNLWKTRFMGCCMVFRREVLSFCLPIPTYVITHDFWIGMLSLTSFRVRFIPDILMCYRRHGDNASSSSEKSRLSAYVKVTYRLNLLVAVVIRILSRRRWKFQTP